MSEYLGITYTFKTSREQKDGRVEADIEFRKGTAYRCITFMFNSLEQAQAQFHTRSQKKIDHYIENRQRKITMAEIGEAFIAYFKNNETLSKTDALEWYNKSVDVEGAI